MMTETSKSNRSRGIQLLSGEDLQAALEIELRVLKATGDALDRRAEQHGIGYLDRSNVAPASRTKGSDGPASASRRA